MKFLIVVATLLTLGACASVPDASNGVVCWQGQFNAPWNASANGNGVQLDAHVDVTEISVDQWIALYEAFCQST